jgi:hypothetical protein
MPSMAQLHDFDYPRPTHPCVGARRREGEAGLSLMHLTCIGAAKRVQRFLLRPGPQCKCLRDNSVSPPWERQKKTERAQRALFY